MEAQTLISIGLGVLGAGVLLGPRVWDLSKKLMAKKPAPLTPGLDNPEMPRPGQLVLDLDEPHLETVLQLSALVGLRAHLAGDPKAQEVIDTVLAPSVLQASEGSHESK